MSRGSRPKNAVLVCRVPAGFKPQRPHDLPMAIGEAELHVRNVRYADALAFSRVFNKHQLETGLADGRWALVVRLARGHWIEVDSPGNGNGTQAAAIERRLYRAAAIVAAGATLAKAAEVLGISPEVLCRTKQMHPDLWKRATEAARAGLRPTAGDDNDTGPAGDVDAISAAGDQAARVDLDHVKPEVTRDFYAGQAAATAAEIPTGLPAVDQPGVRTITPTELLAIFGAADRMTAPQFGFWRAMLLVAVETGLRLDALLSIEADSIDPASPADARFSPLALRYLEPLKAPGCRIFRWPADTAAFHRAFDHLQQLAGIPADRRFTFHALRRFAHVAALAAKGGAI